MVDTARTGTVDAARTGARPTPPDAAHLPVAARWLLVVALGFVLASGGTYLAFVLTGEQPGAWFQAWYLFDVGRERNIPTWFASFLWACLGLLSVLSAVLTGRRAAWSVVAGVAFLASIDESAELHERLDVVGNRWASALGVEVWFTWVIPAIPVVLVVVALLIPLARDLPRGQRRVLVVAAGLFLVGAIVMETVSGLVLSAFDGVGTWHYVVVTLIEEMLELLGLALAVGAVAGLYVWRRSPGGLQVRFRGWAERPNRDGAGRIAEWASSGPRRK